MSESKLEYLFDRYVNNVASEEEEKELMVLIAAPENKKKLDLLLQQLIIQTKPEFQPPFESEEAILQAIFQAKRSTKVVSIGLHHRRRWIAAAAIFLVVASSIWYLANQRVDNKPPIQGQIKTDVPPGKEGAVLTLSNGQQILLDSTNGVIASEGGANIVNKGNVVRYDGTGVSTNVAFNTISTPRGRNYQLLLEDGSKVWLNAASSLRFPTAFAGKERTVELTGEGYFEVAHNAAMPFQVKAGEMTVRVLGTHFNISSYEDEPAVRATLIEGSVNVSKNEKLIQLSPGQQAALDHSGELTLHKYVNTDEIIAWKEGYIHFENADLKTILRQVARWYDIEVVYEGATSNRTFFVIVKRSNSLKKVLEALQDNNVKYTIEGKKLIVRSS